MYKPYADVATPLSSALDHCNSCKWDPDKVKKFYLGLCYRMAARHGPWDDDRIAQGLYELYGQE